MGRKKSFQDSICLTCKKIFYRRTHGYETKPKYCSITCYHASGKAGGFKKGHTTNLGKRIKTKDIKDVARYFVKNAVRDGRLIKSNNCENCGLTVKRIEGHHYQGYEEKNWLKVKWLCVSCHRKFEKNV